jgi:RHS repeat-associated protein
LHHHIKACKELWPWQDPYVSIFQAAFNNEVHNTTMRNNRTRPFNLVSTILALGLLTIGSVHAAETITYYHLDALGSPVAATDEQGNLKWREDYKPYGEKIRNEPASSSNSRAYTGHPHDNDTGLTYAGARYYDPVVGRFMAVDPKGFGEGNLQSFNRYGYANNNPYSYVDRDGKVAIFVPLIVWAVGEGINLYIEATSPPPPGCGNDCVQQSWAGMPGPIGGTAAGKVLGGAGREAAEATAERGAARGIDDLINDAGGKVTGRGDIVVEGGRDRAKDLFREHDAMGVGNRSFERDTTGGGRGVAGELEDGTPLRIRMKPDGTTRINAGDQKFIFPPE